MKRPGRRKSMAGLTLAFALLAKGDVLRAQAPDADRARIDRLEKMLQSVVEENQRLAGEVRILKSQLDQRTSESKATPPTPPPALPAELRPVFGTQEEAAAPIPNATEGHSTAVMSVTPNYKVTYNNGFTIFPENIDDSPFSLKVNNQNTFRYAGFVRSVPYWTDSTGNRLPINDSSNFQIPRGRLIFSGAMFLPKLSYLVNIDYNTVSSNPIGFRAYALNYHFNDAIELSVGQNKVPGSREWLGGSFVANEGADRTMATTFFRPSLSQGIWVTGEPVTGLYYYGMLSNGFNTVNLTPSQLNNRYCWSGSAWWEPWGKFGSGYADIEAHEEAAVRLGASYTYSIERGTQANSNAPENSSIRLTDGTLITQPGAFAPGVTLQKYDISLTAIDLAYKRRGFSLSSEFYFRNLLGLSGNGPLPIHSTGAYGGFLQGGYFVVPQSVEIYARTSFVTGLYGSGQEYAGGVSWFPLKGKSSLRYNIDATWVEHSPADQNRTGFVAGQSGFLFRTQITTSF